MKTHVLASLLVLTLGTAAAAAPAASCSLQSTSRLDSILNPTVGSDERFFTAGSGPPNIMFLLDTSCSMQRWPVAWSNNNSNSFDDDNSGAWPGCRQGNIDALGYDPLVTYAKMWINGTTESPWFVSTSFYRFDGTGSTNQSSFNMGDNPINFAVPPTNTTINTNIDNACNDLTGSDSAALAPCKACLVAKGYFQYEDDRRLAIGNFLNFYGPRGQGALNAMTNAIKNSTKARFGVIAFSAGNGAPNTYQWPGNSVNLFQGMGPSCADSLLPAQIASNSSSLITKLSSYTRFNTATPLDQYLFAGMHYFRGTADPFPTWFPGGYPTDSNFTDTANSGNPAVCFACGFSAMILLTDGQPNQGGFEIPAEIRALNIPCPSCNSAGAAIGDDTQGSNSHIFRTADWAWNHDLRPELAGQQRIATYTVAYALNDPDTLALLQATATAGGGNYYLATNSSQLSQSLSAIINDVTNRNIAFSSSSISSFQSGSTNAAVLPRMAPGKNNLPWQGSLWRFNQFNEFVEDAELNNDADFSDIFVVDSTVAPTAAAIVLEDANGLFVKGTVFGPPAVPFWEARSKMLTLADDTSRNILTVLDTSADGRLNGSDAMSAFSKANWATLAPYLGILGTTFCPKAAATGICDSGGNKGQFCLTNVDCGGAVGGVQCTGGFCDSGPDVGLACAVAGDCGGAGSGNCTGTGTVVDGAMAGKFGLSASQMATAVGVSFAVPATPTQAELDETCVKALIQFIRGQDLGDEDTDGTRSELRASVLGDIFHSSPQVVDPPVDQFLCDKAIPTQCVRTLYAQDMGVPATPMATSSVARCGAAASNISAYDQYLHTNRRREKVVVVGANDGMLHAFLDSTATETQAGGLCTITYAPPTPWGTGNSGGGGELWAFIPPDQLSRLQDLVLGHQYYVDGDAMIRDVWADGSGAPAVPDGIKQADEYHTVAIVASGRGGVHYFALQMNATATASGTTGGGVTQNPKFLWMFPQPNTREAALAGKSLLSLAPRPPPVGPVLLKDTSPKGIAGRYPGDPTLTTEERWVAFLSGGWSPGNEKGRGIYMVDAYNGVAALNGSPTGRPDNLLWKMEYDKNATGKLQPLKDMIYGITAPVAMADYGAAGKRDGYFDSALVGDLGGQLWLSRFFVPGEITGGGQLIDNWSGGRSFHMDRDGFADNSKSIRYRSPFFYIAALIIQRGEGLRAMVGTGDRNSLLDANAGGCRFDNPMACAKYGCDVKMDYEIERFNYRAHSVKLEFTNAREQNADTAITPRGYTACGFGNAAAVKAKIKNDEIKNCPKQGGGMDDFNDVRKMDVECGQDPLGNFACRRTDNNASQLSDLNWPIETSRLTPGTLATPGWLGNNRFFSAWIYGGRVNNFNGPVFDETGAASPTAKDYDDLRLSDRTAGDNLGGDLLDVTAATCTSAGVCTGPQATLADRGWVIDYDGLPFKTGGGSSVLNGCAVWNVVYPSVTVGTCSTSAAKSRFYAADYVTGMSTCASGLKNLTTAGVWDKYAVRDVLAPPPEPPPVIAISKTGKIRYSSVLLEPGAPQATELVVSQGDDVLQSVASLPLTRQEHLCRHVGRAFCTTVQP